MNAGLSVGGYAWARFGFILNQSDWNRLRMSFTSGGRQSVMDRLPANVREQVKMITKIDDPKAIWLLAALRDDDGKSVGKKLLLGTGWSGKIDLNNKEQYAAVRAYVEHRKPKSALAAMGLNLASVLAEERSIDPLEDMLDSKEGNDASDKLAVNFAMKHGWSRVQAMKWFSDFDAKKETKY